MNACTAAAAADLRQPLEERAIHHQPNGGSSTSGIERPSVADPSCHGNEMRPADAGFPSNASLSRIDLVLRNVS